MKKVVKVFIILIFCLGFINVYAKSQTLGDLKNELANLRAEKAAADAEKNKTQSEINAQNNNIANAHAEVEKSKNDIEGAKQKIKESNKKISKTKDESKKLLVFYQKLNGDESVLNYVSGASNMTDLVMRVEAISQILNYNQKKLKSLENLIVENEQLQVDLKKYQEQLADNIVKYEKNLKSLKNDLSSLVEVNMDIQDQINAQSELIKYYEGIGCKDNEDLSVCASVASSARWLKPVNKGYISSGFGYRSFNLNGRPYSDYHPAYDIAGTGAEAPIYAAANGTVAAVIYKASCGGNQIYLHVRVQGKAYTLHYAHMMDMFVKVGDSVTQQTKIGTVGGGGRATSWDGCSTGYHLHFGVATGFYLGGGSEGYSGYSTFISRSIAPPMLPGYGNWFYSRY